MPRLVVIVREQPFDPARSMERVFGIYHSYYTAECDAAVWGGIVLPVEAQDQGAPVKRLKRRKIKEWGEE